MGVADIDGSEGDDKSRDKNVAEAEVAEENIAGGGGQPGGVLDNNDSSDDNDNNHYNDTKG